MPPRSGFSMRSPGNSSRARFDRGNIGEIGQDFSQSLPDPAVAFIGALLPICGESYCSLPSFAKSPLLYRLKCLRRGRVNRRGTGSDEKTPTGTQLGISRIAAGKLGGIFPKAWSAACIATI